MLQRAAPAEQTGTEVTYSLLLPYVGALRFLMTSFCVHPTSSSGFILAALLCWWDESTIQGCKVCKNQYEPLTCSQVSRKKRGSENSLVQSSSNWWSQLWGHSSTPTGQIHLPRTFALVHLRIPSQRIRHRFPLWMWASLTTPGWVWEVGQDITWYPSKIQWMLKYTSGKTWVSCVMLNKCRKC